MAVSASAMMMAMQPTVRQITGTSTPTWGFTLPSQRPQMPKFPPGWKKLYYEQLTAVATQVWLEKRKPNVRARLEKLNPEFREGQKIRGWHPKMKHQYMLDRDVATFRDFYDKWGVWPEKKKSNAQHFFKSGRRRFVSGVLYMAGPGCDF